MFICACVCGEGVSVCMHACVCVSLCSCCKFCVCVCVCVHACVCVHVANSLCACVCVHACVCVCVCVCVFMSQTVCLKKLTVFTINGTQGLCCDSQTLQNSGCLSSISLFCFKDTVDDVQKQ